MGHDFLRHIQRTRVLIHLLDGLAADPLLDLAQINSELALFDPDLAKKPQVVALNKIDLPEVQERWPAIARRLKGKGYEAFSISAVTGSNVRQVLYRAAQLLEEAPPPAQWRKCRFTGWRAIRSAFSIERSGDGWRVNGEAIERAAAMTYWEHFQSMRRFQRILETLGIDKALRQAGVQVGRYRLYRRL